MIIAVDFDGTLCTHDFPRIGKAVGGEKVCKMLTDAGHKLILHTMRSGKSLDEAVQWCKQMGIELYAVNENPQQKEWTSSPKTYAELYIDDAALGVPLIHGKHHRPYVDWNLVYEILRRKGILSGFK